MSSRTILSEHLKALQKLKRKNQTEFAGELGISRSTLCAIYREKENTTIDSLDHMAKKLGKPAAALLSATGDSAGCGSLMLIRERDLEQLTPETREELLRCVCKAQKELSQRI